MRRVFVVGLAAFVMGFAPALPAAEAAPPKPYAVPRAVAAFSIRDAGGKEIASASFTGTPVTLHFWATWCAPCVKELPELAKFLRKNPAARVIPVALGAKNAADVRAFLQEKKITGIPIYYDTEMQALRAVRLQGLPATLFLNAKGEETARHNGPLPWNAPWVAGKK